MAGAPCDWGLQLPVEKQTCTVESTGTEETQSHTEPIEAQGSWGVTEPPHKRRAQASAPGRHLAAPCFSDSPSSGQVWEAALSQWHLRSPHSKHGHGAQNKGINFTPGLSQTHSSWLFGWIFCLEHWFYLHSPEIGAIFLLLSLANLT